MTTTTCKLQVVFFQHPKIKLMSDSRFSIEKKEFYTLINITSDKLDAQLSPILKSEFVLIAGNGEKNLLINLSKVHYCDSCWTSAQY